MTTTTDIYDEEGNNATASFLLNDHHDLVPVSGYNDDIADNCEVCHFAAGWVQPTDLGPDEHGHSTRASSQEVQEWINSFDTTVQV